MKNKKITIIALMIILVSQFSVGITVLATTETSFLENSTHEIITEETLEENETKFIPESGESENKDVVIGPSEFVATPRGSTITATSPVIWVPLGADEDVFNTAYLNEGIIKIDGKTANPGEFMMHTAFGGDTDAIDASHDVERWYISSVVDKANSENRVSIDNKYKLNYGNSIVFESEGRIAGAFTHNVKTYPVIENYYDVEISANSGIGSRNDVINSSYGDKEYYKIEAFSFLGNFENPNKSVVAKGNDKKGDVLNRWKNLRVNEGSIIRTWSAEPANNKFYVSNKANTQKLSYANKDGYAYYKVTKEGLEPFTTMPLKVVPQTITTRTTDEQLDNMLDDLFEEIPDGVEVDKFIEYPKRNKEGKSSGKVQVTETSSYTQNKEVKQIYEIPFTVIEVPLEVEMKEDISILLGEKEENIDVYDFIESVFYEGEELDRDEYTAEFVAVPNTFYIGVDDVIEIEVTLNEDTDISGVFPAKADILWGNTIVSRSESSANSEMMTSISLLEDNKNPYLKMTYGTGNNNRVRSGNDIQIYRKNADSILFSEREDLSWSYQFDAIKTWQPKLDTIDFEYGDVLKQNVFDRFSESFKGMNTYVSRDEELVRETEGYEDAYYELTKDGYRLLQLNQLGIKNNALTFEYGASQEEINEQAGSAVIIPAHIKDTDKFRYELDVDTTKLGKNKGKINIYEKLDTKDAGEFMISKDVDYVVEQNVVVKLKENTIPVGTPSKDIKVSDYIESVTDGGKELGPKDYTATIENSINTNLVSSQDTKIKVKIGNNEVSKTTKTNVIWGHTIGSSKDGSEKEKTDVSISMLHDLENPYLIANEGIGFGKNASSLSYINVYRSSTDKSNEVFYSRHYYPKGNPEETMDLLNNGGKWWNGNTELVGFKDTEFKYGDVLTYETRQYGDPEIQEKSIRTFAVRDEKLVKESEGYDKAFYEMTKDGFRLMTLNQIVEDNQSLALDLTTGDTQDTIDKQVAEKIDLKGKDKNNFRFVAEDIDTKTSGKKTGNIQIYEKLTTSGEFMTLLPISYEVEQGYSIELKENIIPVGTPIESINPNNYIKSVSDGTKELDPKDYTVTIENTFNTMKVSNQETKIKVVVEGNNLVGNTTTKILWGNTIASKSTSGSNISTSISLLENNSKPYLVANEGTGFSRNPITIDPTISAYRGDIKKQLFVDGTSAGVDKTPRENMEKWNKMLETTDLEYGDVFGFTMLEENGTNSNGKRTWAVRDEQLVLETEGYEGAYYEMTKNGFRLMHFNQLEVNSKMPVVSINTTIEEMNKTAKEAMIIPKHITNTNDYRFEYASVDTKTSGIKTTQMNVYEKLSTGGEFKTTYEVKYQVNPQLTETYSDVTGKKIKEPKMNNFDFGTKYTPTPENYITVGDEVYSYAGWLAAGKKPGKDKPNTSKVPSFTKEDTIQYIYEKADNLINMTIPTELLFGTDGNSKNITSKNYGIKNNSDNVSTEVSLSEFKKEKSDVKLLTSKDKDPSKTQQSARLNVTSNGTEVIKSLTESTKDQTIITLAPGQDTSIGLTGTYFGNLNESTIVHYQMQFKFKVIPN